jgi:NAD(P)-dependent dehydrogenase (short-subunit alcohol dehydrogenase family)
MASRAGRLLGWDCLIVGGTSGIGLAAARRFLDEGAKVVVAGLTPMPRAAREALEQAGPLWELTADVRHESQVAALFEFARQSLGGRIDVLFHAAGISGRRLGDGPLHECSDGGWSQVLEANATSAFLTNRAAVRIMRGQPRREGSGQGLRGTVVNLGSVLSHAPAPAHFATIAYTASKGAVRALTLAAAAQYAAQGIRFNLIEPGLIDTPMAARAVGDPAIRSYLATKQPIAGGPGTAGDVAEAALYLCEPASRFVTGVVLNVDGGWCVSEGRLPPGDPGQEDP